MSIAEETRSASVAAGAAGDDSLPALLTRIAGADESQGYDLVDKLVEMAIRTDDLGPPQRPSSGSVPFLYDAAELQGECPAALVYTVKRLIKGLASTTHQTRLNYAAALLAVLSEHGGRLSPPVILKWAQSCLSVNSLYGTDKAGSIAENAIYAAQLVVLDVLIRSYDVKPWASVLLSDLFRIWRKRDSLCILAQNLIARLLQAWQPSLAEFEALSSVRAIAKTWRPSCMKRAALLLLISSALRHPQIRVQGCDVLDAATLKDPAAFVPLLRGVEESHELESPKCLVFIQTLLVSLLAPDQPPERFLVAWSEAINLCRLNGRPGTTLLLRLLSTIAGRDVNIGATDFASCLSEEVLSSVVSLPDGQITETVDFSQASDEKLALVISALLVQHRLRGAQLAAAILYGFDAQRLARVLMLSRNCSVEGAGQRALPYRQKLYQTLANQSKSSRDIVGGLLPPIMAEMADFTEPQQELQTALQSVLGRAVSVLSADDDIESLLGRCLAQLDPLYCNDSREGKARRRALDEPVRDSLKKVTKLLPRLDQKLQDPNLRADARALLSICRQMAFIAKFLLIVDPVAVADIFDDLKDYIKRLSKPEGAQEEQLVIDALLEILLQWLSRPSILLRKLACHIVGKHSSTFAKTSGDSLARILTTRPGGEEQEDLLEDEGGDDDDDDDVIEIDAPSSAPKGKGRHLLLDLVSAALEKKSKDPVDKAQLGEEGDDADLDKAGEEELNQLDAQLKGIMQARKAQQKGAHITQKTLVHFKQRILDVLQTIVQAPPTPQILGFAERMAVPLLKCMAMHSGERLAKQKGNSEDQELSKRLTPIFDLVAAAIGATESAHSWQEGGGKLMDELLELVKTVGLAGPAIISRTCGLLSKVVTKRAEAFPSSQGQGKDTPLATMTAGLQPLWTAFVTDLQKSHACPKSLMSFFGELRLQMPDAFLDIVAESAGDLMRLRTFARAKIVRMMDPCWGKAASKDCKLVETVLERLANSYLETVQAEDSRLLQLSPENLKEELSLIAALVAKSRFGGGERLLQLWDSLLDHLGQVFCRCKWYKGEDSLTKSLRDRLKSTRSLIIPKTVAAAVQA